MKTFDDAFTLLEVIQSSKAANTLAQSMSCIAHLRPWFAVHCPSLEVFETSYEETWSAYKAFQNEQCVSLGKKPRMLGHERRTLVMTLKRAQKKGWINKAFSKVDFQLMEFSEPVGKHVDEASIQKLSDYLKTHSEKTYLQFLMALTMGMRISEVLHIRKEEIDLTQREINLDPKRLKTRRARRVPIPITSIVFPLLEARHKVAGGVFIFPAEKRGKLILGQPQQDNSYWWTKARSETGVDCRFHDLRHTCLSNALANGMPPLTASKIFGCTQAVLERVYDHIRLKDRQLHRDILDGIPQIAK